MTLTFGSLFAGIGGLDLGLERAGMICKWQVEIDDYATRVLTKHWPDVPKFRDVRSVGAHDLSTVDLICGGFPCQDISSNGKRVGITGIQSGLWFEYARIVRELRPRYVLVQNVAAPLFPIRRRKHIVEPAPIGNVLGDLATLGYDAVWHCIPAAAVGAPHNRDRVYIMAYADQERGGTPRPNENKARIDISSIRSSERSSIITKSCAWAIEPDVGRVADGIPHRMERLGGLGNAVVPQVAEFVGRMIVEYEATL